MINSNGTSIRLHWEVLQDISVEIIVTDISTLYRLPTLSVQESAAFKDSSLVHSERIFISVGFEKDLTHFTYCNTKTGITKRILKKKIDV